MTAHTWPGDALQAEVTRLERELRLAESRVSVAEVKLAEAESQLDDISADLLRARNELKGGPQ